MDIESLARRFDEAALMEAHENSRVGLALKLVSLAIIVLMVAGFIRSSAPSGGGRKKGRGANTVQVFGGPQPHLA
jgi:hypothetical protein